MTVLAIAVGGALGALLRWAASGLNRPTLPLGTLVANTVATGALAFARDQDAAMWLTVGVLGAASTWSSFVVETADMVKADRPRRAAGYVAATISLGVAAAVLAGG